MAPWNVLNRMQTCVCHPPLTYWMLESRPWVMTPVNLVVLLVSTSIHWV